MRESGWEMQGEGCRMGEAGWEMQGGRRRMHSTGLAEVSSEQDGGKQHAALGRERHREKLLSAIPTKPSL